MPLFRSLRRLFRSGSALLCCLPCLLCVLLFVSLFLPVAGNGVALHFRVFLYGGPVLIFSSSLDVLAFSLVDCLLGMLPNLLLGKPCAMPQNILAYDLCLMCALGADIFMLHLVDFPMHIAVYGVTHSPPRFLYGAGLFRWFLIGKTLFCFFQIVSPFFHTELGRSGLLHITFLTKLGFRRLRDILSRSTICIFLTLHEQYPPGEWSADCKSRPWGNGLQKESLHYHRTEDPRRNWNG